MSYKYCQHVRENGVFCKSPSLKGRNYCYYHARMRARRLAMARAQAEKKAWHLDLPPLEDMHAVQSAISNVLEAIAAGAIDSKSGGLILYGLQQAANNVRDVQPWLGSSRFEIDESEDRRVDGYPGLETEFDLPKNVDLEAVPEVTFPPPQQLDPETVFPPKKPPVNLQGLKAWKKVLAEAEQELKKSS